MGRVLDPLDVAAGGLDVSGLREGLFAMAEPLDQELSFTVLVPLFHLSRVLKFSLSIFLFFSK